MLFRKASQWTDSVTGCWFYVDVDGNDQCQQSAGQQSCVRKFWRNLVRCCQCRSIFSLYSLCLSVSFSSLLLASLSIFLAFHSSLMAFARAEARSNRKFRSYDVRYSMIRLGAKIMLINNCLDVNYATSTKRIAVEWGAQSNPKSALARSMYASCEGHYYSISQMRTRRLRSESR